MAEAILITIDDIREYRKLDSKYDQTRFEAFAMEVQRKNLRDLLGQGLYYDFMDDARTSGKYKDLLDGKSYTYNGDTIQYYGLKPVLVYWWLAVMNREGELFHTTFGASQFTNNTQQQFENAKEKERISSDYMETAQRYANDVIQFLDENSSTYTLWESKSKRNQTNFISIRI